MSKEAKILFSIGGVIIVVLVAFGFLFGNTNPNDKSVDEAILVSPDSQIKKATGEEKVVVVEFSDFQCPACSVVEPTITQLLKTYGENVTFVYRYFPLSGHPHGELAALAAAAAGAQGKFWEMHDQLFTQQADWGSLANPLDTATVREKIIGYATALGLNVEQFTADLDNQTYLSAIQQGKTDGAAANITGTPSFFVNGVPTEVSDFETAVSAAVK
ncbi:MAG: DsbA oxidoreductase [uncultured bacterium]|nr:MAG: DsbA oxidoreductase [uncultured bacterium]